MVEAPGPFILSLRPFLAARDRHALTSANSEISQETPFEDWTLRLRPYQDGPEVFIRVPGADFRANPQWWYRFEYEADRRRGLEFQEDLWTPGLFGRELQAGDRLGIVISTQDPAGRDAFALLEKERKRREKILKALPVQDDFARSLALATDRFVVRRGSSQRTVIAGYPGQEERSRDTMIALPGLFLVTGRHEGVKKILRAFAKSLSPEPTLVDASLWLFVASWKYLQATGDEVFVRETLLPALRKVKAREAGLLEGNLEVNALWVNALSILADLEARLGDPEEAKRMAQASKRAQKGFLEAFWSEERGDLKGGTEQKIFALSLPFPLLPKSKAARVLAAIEEKAQTRPELLGPYLTALVCVHGAAGRKKGLAAIEALMPRLAEAGVGSLFGGPWSVAEVLRAYVEDLRGGEKPAPRKAASPAKRRSKKET